MRPLILILLAIILSAPAEAFAAKRKTAAKKETPAELFRRAEAAADDYRFAEAAEILEAYDDALGPRVKAPVSEEERDILASRIERGRLMMDRVEKIVVIDSIAVPRDGFFRAFRLDPAAGSLHGAEALPKGVEGAEGTTVFIPESGQTMTFAVTDSLGRSVIAELSLLADGSYEPITTYPELNIESEDSDTIVNAIFPFLMADGITLYYASNNPELSLGGYDIFFSRRDGDGFYQPQNIGMPYNSPADDFLLAIDEATGTGWWATDRNAPGSDTITIYRFIPNELRTNYNASETPNLPALARLDSYRMTQPAGADYSELLARPVARAAQSAPQFRLSIPGVGVVTSLDELRTARGRKLVKEWLAMRSHLSDDEARLDTLRRDYARGNHGVSSEILNLERSIPSQRSRIAQTLNEIVSAESR